MPYDLMSLPLLVGLVGGAFWLVVFAAVTAAAKMFLMIMIGRPLILHLAKMSWNHP
jgi:hypothetical protein